MKKILSVSLVAAMLLGFGACKKINSNTDGRSPVYTAPIVTPPAQADPLAEVGSLPIDFTKKAILEENTGEWCGWCPEGAVEMESIIANNPDKVVGMAVHDGDPMEVASYNTWQKGLTNVGGFPNGSVSRADAVGRGQWAGQVTTELAKTAKAGLAIVSKKNGSNYDIKVFVGYTASIPAGQKLTVAITEDKIPQSSPGAQSNYSSSVTVDANWLHSHVFRGTVTAEAGDDIDLTSPKKYTIVEFKNVDLSTMNIKDVANAHVVAFINDNAGARSVENAQEVKLGSTKKWD